MKNTLRKLWKEYGTFSLFLLLMFMFRSAIADWNTVPSGSMKPTLLEGDRIGVNNLAYDLRIPFTHISLMKLGDPIRGDIATFDSNVSGKRLVKRVIGVPGDVISMSNNKLTINGQTIDYTEGESLFVDGKASQDFIENLQGIEHSIRIAQSGSQLSTFNSVRVPANQYLMLGDNRDNSADSRVIGFVPRSEFMGRAANVVMSFNYDNYYIPRSDRFFHPLK
jgi:signal peptidase I